MGTQQTLHDFTLDLLSVNRTVNEFDIYVGTSAGSFVASLAANGVTPEESKHKIMFENLTPLFPKEQFKLERHREFLATALRIVMADGLAGLTMQRLADEIRPETTTHEKPELDSGEPAPRHTELRDWLAKPSRRCNKPCVSRAICSRPFSPPLSFAIGLNASS